MNESLIKKGVNGIGQLVESIAGSEYWNKVAPGMKQLQQEVGERIAKNKGAGLTKDSVEYTAHLMAETFYNFQNKAGQDYSALEKELIGKIKNESSIDAIFKEYGDIFEGFDEDFINKLKLGMKSNLDTSAGYTPEEAYKTATTFQKLIETPKTYFTHPDKSTRNARILTAAGGYAAASVGARYLTGGTLTRDSYGRNDIAGIPFI